VAVQESPQSIPRCNPKDPTAFTTDTKIIDRALASVIGYSHAFNSGKELVEDPVVGFNACHAAISSARVRGNIVPMVVVSGCAVTLANPAKACQAGNRIRFVVDNSNASGLLEKAGPEFELNFSKATADHWRVTSPVDRHVNLTFKEAEVGR
jgi:hypothetical protein